MKEIEPRLCTRDEEIIESYKSGINIDGYSFIKKQFEYLTKVDKSPALYMCHLLSIARWEYQHETEKKTECTLTACALCLYFNSVCERCILWNGLEYKCCDEYTHSKYDNGKALIIKLRQKFVEKYYKEDNFDCTSC